MVQTYDNPILSMDALILSHNEEAKLELPLCKVDVASNSDLHCFYVVFVLLADVSWVLPKDRLGSVQGLLQLDFFLCGVENVC